MQINQNDFPIFSIRDNENEDLICTAFSLQLFYNSEPMVIRVFRVLNYIVWYNCYLNQDNIYISSLMSTLTKMSS